MASSKPDLARAGTMQATAKDGESFLDRNLSEWRKPYLMDHFEGKDEGGDEEESGSGDEAPTKKAKMSKHTTMKGTAKEAETLLAGDRPDEDAQTRGQQKKIDDIKAEKSTPKKARMARDNTMAATAKEARGLLSGEKLADTRQETKRKSKPGSLKKETTIEKVVAEAQAVYGDMDTSEGRQLRKRPERKPAMKKAGTMQATAKEGKAFLKRSKKDKK